MSEDVTVRMLQRLDRLERENRRLKAGVGIILLAVVATGLMGQAVGKAVPKVIEAEQFLLRDANGVIRAVLKTAANAPVGLAFADSKGRNRLHLGVDTDGLPGLGLFNEGKKPRAVLNVLDDGSVGLTLSDQAGEPRIVLGVTAEGKTAITPKR